MRVEDEVGKLPFWNQLTPAEKEYISGNAAIRRFPKGMLLQACGESCLGMVFVLGGRLRVIMLSEEGREITLFRLAAGETCIFSASCVLSQISFESQIIAEEDTDLLIINAGVSARLTEKNIHVRCFVYELAAERFSTVVRALEEIIFSRFDRRLAAFLLRTYEENGHQEICMTQESIAREVNTAREVVARMLRQFSEEGYVKLTRGRITVSDPEGLKRLL